MAKKFEITRRLVIEAGHRVLLHASKCKNVHGHRYIIEATAKGELQQVGSETGMVTDFSVLKNLMVELIEAQYDHSMIAWVEDVKLLSAYEVLPLIDEIRYGVANFGSYRVKGELGYIIIVGFIPTAENLAKHWFDMLNSRISFRVPGVQITKVKVWETENCSAEYTGEGCEENV